MSLVNIKEPIWSSKSVGIATYKVIGKILIVKILYKDKLGNRVYPGTYWMLSTKARSYPIENHGVLLYIIPIDDFEVE